jgi:hypothetical protein
MVFAGLWVAGTAFPLRADYLKNTDFSDGLAGWHGDGEAAFLKANGTEGDEGDPGVTPVIKLPLSKGSSRSIYQDFETPDQPKTLQFKVDVYASSDFKRSASPDDYTPEISYEQPGSFWIWNVMGIPTCDFWICGAPGYTYKLANLQRRNWIIVKVNWNSVLDSEERTINFCVPPGDGVVYLKNPSVTP